MTTRDPQRPDPAEPVDPAPDYDPAQLSFGDVAAVPQLRVDRHAEGSSGADDLAVVMYREPPVCGESSYDNMDDAGPSWSVRIVQEAESKPASARAASASAGARGHQAPAGAGGVRASGPRPSASAGQAPVRPARAAEPRLVSNGRAAIPPRLSPLPRAVAVPPRTSTMPAAMIAPMRPTPVAMPSASLEPLRRATELSPRDVDAAIGYAYALDKHGNAAGAMGALDACVTAGGDEVRLICARAFLLGSRLKYDAAEAELKRAAKLRADDPDVLLHGGILACRRARWRDAVEPLQRAASQRDDDALAQFYLGEALNHVDQLPAALAAYENAARLDPANWRAFKGVGIVLDRLSRPADAAVAYRQMREAQGR